MRSTRSAARPGKGVKSLVHSEPVEYRRAPERPQTAHVREAQVRLVQLAVRVAVPVVDGIPVIGRRGVGGPRSSSGPCEAPVLPAGQGRAAVSGKRWEVAKAGEGPQVYLYLLFPPLQLVGRRHSGAVVTKTRPNLRARLALPHQ